MADDKSFRFEILTLQKSFLTEDVRFVIAVGQDGVFEILANHAPYVFALKPGPLRMKTLDGMDKHIAVGAGFLVVQKDCTTVLTRSAEHPDEIDVPRAQRAKERAEQRLTSHVEAIDEARARSALQRALARLKVAEHRRIET